jgi:RecG-like helicase
MWDSPLEFLKGVGPQRAALLAGELGMRTVGDLLQHYPFRYVDRSQFYSISQAVDGPAEIQLRGRITKITEAGAGPKKRLVAQFEDATGTLELVWFQGVKWVRGSLPINEDVVVYGKVHGNIVASDRVELKATAEVVGDIKAKTLAIEPGAPGHAPVGKRPGIEGRRCDRSLGSGGEA